MKLLTKENLMWAAIALLAYSSYSLHTTSDCGCETSQRGLRQRVHHMQYAQGQGSRWDGMSKKEEAKADKRGSGRRKHKPQQ
jgi:hypothetical protein